MDAYNRYLMRASGERKHQAQSPAEAAAFAACDVLKKKGIELFTRDGKHETETANSEIMDKLVERIEVAIRNWR